MSVLKGLAYITDDVGLVRKAMDDKYQKGIPYMILSMDEEDNEIHREFYKDVFPATCLLPPPDAIFHMIDGDLGSFVDEYKRYLDGEYVVVDFVTGILSAMTFGQNILFYVPSFGEDVQWINIFLSYLDVIYGIHVSTSPMNPPINNPVYDVKNLFLMYSHNSLPFSTFMQSLPENIIAYPPDIAGMIATDMRRNGYISMKDDPIKAFNDIKQMVHINPQLTMGVEFC